MKKDNNLADETTQIHVVFIFVRDQNNGNTIVQL